MAGNSSEVFKLEEENVFSLKFTSRADEIEKKFARPVDRKQGFFSRRRPHYIQERK